MQTGTACAKPPASTTPQPTDPLVLDLGGTGFDITAVGTSTVFFDILNDGFGNRTAWVGPTNGLLALDRNGNGTIDNVRELFGNATTNGFSALGALDANRDGVINAADDQFGDLRIWQDLNGDGITDAGELQTLTARGITALSLAATPSTTVVNGNTIPLVSTFTRADGTTGAVGSVNFAVDHQTTRYIRPPGFTVSPLAAALPVFAGCGRVARTIRSCAA